MDETPQDAALENAAAEPNTDAADHDWPPWAEGFLAALQEVPNYSRAAKQAGIDRRTAERLRKRDEAFALAVHDAREESLDTLEDTIYRRATIGRAVTKTVTRQLANGDVETTTTEERQVSDTLAMFYLKRWRPEFRETYRVEQSGPNGAPIRHEVGLVEDLASQARADLERLHEEREQAEA